MRLGKALVFGVLGSAAISVLSAALRLAGLPIGLELLLGMLAGRTPEHAFGLGLFLHLGIGGLFGLVYGYLFERVWDHGGALTGVLTAVVHASLIGFFVGFASELIPLIPSRMPDPGPYFAGLGPAGVAAFFGLHLVYGALVGAGYGHVAGERQWAPIGHR